LTKFAHIAKDLTSQHRPTEFDREIQDFSSLIIKIIIFLVIFVFIVNIAFHKPALESILFSLALAVGLTPELLPLIISLNLTRGSLAMAHHGVIVKQLSAVQNFGSMDILCTDKTGTLTEDEIRLVKYLDGFGKESKHVLELGMVTSAFSTAFSNPMDAAILQFKHVDISAYKKIDEIPFDFERKREAVVVANSKGERELIVKGAPEEVLLVSTHYGGKLLKDEVLANINQQYDKLSRGGFRVLGVARRKIETEKSYEPSDESNMEFIGFLAFLDPAKKTVNSTLELMRTYGINIKIITGDNSFVTEKIASDINLKSLGTISGDKIAKLNRVALARAVEENTIFARVDPEQKMLIIEALQKNGHVVGYMGDGINDAPSLRAADVGVSVDNAVDVSKDAADFIMLRKNLHELTLGVIEGRKTFVNTLKYLRMGLSSNFGNMFSMAGASLFLPFLPMKATQILLNNLLYDASQTSIPLDRVDDVDIVKPRIMKLAEIKKFMWSYGLLSSVFDFSTFGVLYLIFHTQQGSFQTGWFIESFLTQTLVVFIIRSRYSPLKSHPSPYLIATIGATITAALLAALTPLSQFFRFGPISWPIIGAIALLVGVYLFAAEQLKKHFF
jgi:Mg2+-importing ATPase